MSGDVLRFKAVRPDVQSNPDASKPISTRHTLVEIDAVAASDYDAMAVERDKLAQAIADVAKSLGIYNGESPLDGPQLLMLCEDIKNEFGLPASPEVAQVEESPDRDWHMHPCKMGHADVGAAGGIAMCNTCEETIRGFTTQKAFETWNKTHPSKQTYCSDLWAKVHLQREFALTVWGRIMSAPVLDDEYRRQVGPVSKGFVEFRGRPDSVTPEELARLFRQALWLLSQREDTEEFRRLDKSVIVRLKEVIQYAEDYGIVTPDPDGLTVCSHPDCARYTCPADKKIACSVRQINACAVEYGPGFFTAVV
jgi:hypothetical protein